MHHKGRAISDPALHTETHEKLLHLLEHDQSAIRCGNINIPFRAHSHRIGKFDHGIAADCSICHGKGLSDDGNVQILRIDSEKFSTGVINGQGRTLGSGLQYCNLRSGFS